LGAAPWFERLWAQRERLRGKPMLLLWGLKDPTFGPSYLEQWRRGFPEAHVHTFPSSGHFVPEEAAAEVGPLVERFVEAPAPRSIAAG
jgi:haloalkane dehalogenase